MPFAALDAALAAFAVGAALAVRPWRMVYGTGPPWVWVVAWATLPVLWCLDRQLGVALPPPLSGAALLVLLTGWPLAVLACVPMAILMGVCGALDALDALHRMVWLGIVPATAALALGAATRRWLPRHVAVYVLGRSFLGTGVCVWLARALAGTLVAPTLGADAGIAHLMLALAEAGTTGAIATLLVAQRPDVLATYSDRLYLPARGAPR